MARNPMDSHSVRERALAIRKARKEDDAEAALRLRQLGLVVGATLFAGLFWIGREAILTGVAVIAAVALGLICFVCCTLAAWYLRREIWIAFCVLLIVSISFFYIVGYGIFLVCFASWVSSVLGSRRT